MPPPPSDRPPAAPPPRKMNPLIPGGWIALGLLLVVAVVLLLLNTTKSVTYTDFKKLADAGQVKKLTLVGKERGVGEVRDANSELAKSLKLSGGQFAVKFPYSDNQNELVKYVETKDQEHRTALKAKDANDATEPVVIDPQDEPFPFLAPALMILLPTLLIVAFFVFFILPRMRDPVGGGFLNNYIRSPAKRYEKTRAKITFDDVAGMESAKRELTE